MPDDTSQQSPTGSAATSNQVTASDAPGSEANAATTAGTVPEDADGGMSDRAQWLVVAALVVAGILAPLYLYLVGPGSFGLGFRDTYLAVPMIPAILLGLVGVWTAVRGR